MKDNVIDFVFVCIFLDQKVQKAETKPEGKASNPTNKFKCEYRECNKSFAYSRNLWLRVQKIHVKISFKCDQFNRIFTENASLKKHIEVVHKKLKNYKCDLCDKLFGKKPSLDSHWNCSPKKEQDWKVSLSSSNLFLGCFKVGNNWINLP